VITPKMLALGGFNLHFYIFFHGPCAKKFVNINTKTIFFGMIVLSTHTPIKHHNNTPFMENLNPKCDKKKYKECQIFKLQNENETKNKNLSIQIISIQY